MFKNFSGEPKEALVKLLGY